MGDVVSLDAARQAIRSTRPRPPETLQPLDDFAPADELATWVFETFIDPDGPLYNPRHEHLREAKIGWLWTTAENTNRNRSVAGECQIIQPIQKKWSSARTHWLLRHWFGTTPDFLITIDAGITASYDDWSFCALIEHELCHAAQDEDAFGEPRFNREGQPMFRVVTHDVEQFNDVVERYGAAAADVEHMVRVANAGPTIGQAQITAACGTCSRRATG